MASAYAALVSAMQILDQLQKHPRPPISLPQQQVQSLTEIVSFLQDFLERGYSSSQDAYDSEADPLEMKIADAAHAAEDLIESHIVDRILADGQEISSLDFYESVQIVICGLESVKKEAMDVINKMQSKHQYYQLPAADFSTSAASSSTDGPEKYPAMVGFDDIFEQVLDKLTSYESSKKVISITGMSGTGKSTLAKNVYQHQFVKEYFHIRAWVTVSQKYNMKEVFMQLLSEEDLILVDEYYDLGITLYQKLFRRRYLIIIDDIWSIEVWEQLMHFFPNNSNHSRIMITTRLSKLARIISDFNIIEMPILDKENCWKLFCKHVFKEEDCPVELQRIGKRIVRGCKGIPQSICVVGELLSRSERTQGYWKKIAKNLNSTLNSENDQHYLRKLYTSYYNLPVYLKPYFLFMGVNLADDEKFVTIKELVAIFIAEGFVKPVMGRSLEEAAKESVIELIERNLVVTDTTKNEDNWMYKECRIAKLLRELCLRESEKQKFIYVVKEGSAENLPQNFDSIRRIHVANKTSKAVVLHYLESAPLLRSLWWFDKDLLSLSSIRSRLLRTVFTNDIADPENFDQKVNLRSCIINDTDAYIRSISSLYRFWNLQTLHVSNVVMAPNEIWMMPQLRSITAGEPLCIPDPPSSETDSSIILENLHSLGRVNNFKCSEEVVKRIPHIKRLGIYFKEVEASYDVDYCLDNLDRLQKLEILEIEVQVPRHIMRNQNPTITFPPSLIWLYLTGISLHWEDVTYKIGSLPLLQRLHLMDSCRGAKWKTMEGHFCSLRELLICGCPDLEHWMTEDTHFPCLKFLYLVRLEKLEEIPSCVGDIPTLEKIGVRGCSASVERSAQAIKEEQEDLGNEDLQVDILGF